MKRSSILCSVVLASTFVSGCATYTMPQYVDELRYEGTEVVRTRLAKEGSLAPCFDMDIDSMARKLHQKMMECVNSERPNRAYEFSAGTLVAYANADATCGNRKFVLEHADSIDLNNIPSKHISVCKNLKETHTE
jgi:hypothetical protein